MKASKTFAAGGGTLGPYLVTQNDPSDFVEETIYFQFNGTWDGDTVTLYTCDDPDASPQQWAAVKNGAFTENISDSMALTSGVAFKAVTTGGTSSPQAAAIYGAFVGQFQAIA